MNLHILPFSVNVLFIHQGFPSQFGKLVHCLLKQPNHYSVRCIGLGEGREFGPHWNYSKYLIQKTINPETHLLAQEFEAKVLRAEGCSKLLWQLKSSNYYPDLVYAHPAWGETLLIKEIWPDAPLLSYQEFFYHTRNSDFDFDNEFIDAGEYSFDKLSRARLKNTHLLMSLNDSQWCISPTQFQKSLFPTVYQPRFSVIHDGIDTALCRPKAHKEKTFIIKAGAANNSMEISAEDQVITYVSRSLEPYRGIHQFVRAIPLIQERNPAARILIAGATSGVSYGKPCPIENYEWHEIFLNEIDGLYDPERVHFLGAIPYAQYLRILQRSNCHIYLTYPFVLSWSLLEAMSCECPVVGSATAPVQEVIKHGHNGLLVDFFKPADLAEAVAEMLNDPERARDLGAAARQTILERYELQSCLKKQMALIELVASRALSAR